MNTTTEKPVGHTPLPWRQMPNRRYIEAYNEQACETVADFGCSSLIPQERREANMALACQAVNAHAELVELLNDVLTGSVNAGAYPDGPCLEKELRDRIRAALAKLTTT